MNIALTKHGVIDMTYKQKSTLITTLVLSGVCLFVINAIAQTSQAPPATTEFLRWFPVISFLISAFVVFLVLKMDVKQGKLKEEIMVIVRHEITELEKTTVTKEQLTSFKETSAEILKRIEYKIDVAAERAGEVAKDLLRWKDIKKT